MAMFPPMGLFRGVQCPKGQDCPLLVCLFSHREIRPAVDQESKGSAHVAPPKNANPSSSPAPKKRKLESTVEDNLQEKRPAVPKRELPTSPAKPAPTELQSTSRKVSPPPRPKAVSTPEKNEPKPSTTPVSKAGTRPPPREARKESLNPRMLSKAPASHAARLSILTKLHSAMSTLNAKMAEDQKNSNKISRFISQ